MGSLAFLDEAGLLAFWGRARNALGSQLQLAGRVVSLRNEEGGELSRVELPLASDGADGLMSAQDKARLDGIGSYDEATKTLRLGGAHGD